MKSYSAYFARSNNLEQARHLFGSADTVTGTPWLICALNKDASPPDDEVLWGRVSLTEAYSRQLGEVIFVFGDTSIDAFVYEHAWDGELVRKLVWFPMLDDAYTPGWLSVAGEPEGWEAGLFRADKLAWLLERERERYVEEGKARAFAEREAEIQGVWRERQIEAGKTYPSCDGTAARLVEEGFGIKRAVW